MRGFGGAAVGGLDHVVALGAEAGAQQAADRRLVVDDEDADGGGGHAACPRRARGGGRQGDGEDGAGAVGAVAGGDRAAHGLDEAAADREAEAGAGAHPVALLRAVELVEDLLDLVGRDALALVDRSRAPAPPAAVGRPRMRTVVPSGAYFAALSSRLKSTCSKSTGSTSTIGRSSARSTSTWWPASTRPARCSALPTISPRSCGGAVRRDGAGFEPGHVEQVGDEAVEPLGLVEDRAERVRRGSPRSRSAAKSRSVPAEPMIAASGVRRSCEIEVSSAWRRRSASAARMAVSTSSTRLTRSIATAAWSDERVEQAALLGGEQRAGALGVEADDADGAAGGAQRHEQAAGAGQRVGAAAGGAVVLVAPVRRGDVGGLERVLGRIAGADRDRAVGVGQQQDHLHVELRGDLVGGGPEHVVERRGAGELAAEGVERLGGAGAAPGRSRAWRRTCAARLETSTATTVKKRKAATLVGSAIVSV